MRGGLTVSEVADALGTSPQTVRAMLRKGQLRGEQRPWGSRYVWEVSPEGLDEFLSEYGRLDGHRRAQVPSPTPPLDVSPAVVSAHPDATTKEKTKDRAPAELADETDVDAETSAEQPVVARRPWFLRPRGRATVVVVVLGLPLLLAYGAVRTVPEALWFHELGQDGTYRAVVEAKLEFRSAIIVAVSAFVWLNLLIAGRDTPATRRPAGLLALAATSLVTGTLFASSVARHWQTYVLWRHRQSFGVVDPVHGKDVGFFVFTLPFELLVSGLLLCWSS